MRLVGLVGLRESKNTDGGAGAIPLGMPLSLPCRSRFRHRGSEDRDISIVRHRAERFFFFIATKGLGEIVRRNDTGEYRNCFIKTLRFMLDK